MIPRLSYLSSVRWTLCLGGLLAAGLVPTRMACAAVVGPAFTYQGRLMDGTEPAEGEYEFRFSLHLTPDGLGVLGEPLTNAPVVVEGGLFTVVLDFGPDAFDGQERWMTIGVRPGGSVEDFTDLAPRQAIRAVPYATHSVSANEVTGPIDASLIESGTLSTDVLNDNVALLDAVQEFTGKNTFSSGVVINPSGETSPLKIVGGTQIPHVAVIPDDAASIGAVLSLDTSAKPGGAEYWIQIVGETGGDDTGKLFIRNATANRDLLTFSTNHFVGINQNSPTNRLHVGGKVQASGFIGNGSELTGLNADAITSGTLSSPLLNTNVALLNRNNQKFTGNNRIQGTLVTGTDTSDNVVISVAGGNLDRGRIQVKDENNTTQASVMATDFGGKLDILDPTGENQASIFISDDQSPVFNLIGKNGTLNVHSGYLRSDRPNYGAISLHDNAGDAKVWTGADEDGVGKLFTYGDNGALNITLGASASADHGGVATWGPDGTPTAALVSDIYGGNINISDTNGVYRAGMFVASDGQGWMVTDVIQINGGADIAEPFAVRSPDVELGHKIEPGMLVAIDPDQAGELRLSTQAYDRTVAGIISGAGGVRTGMTLQQKGTLADGDHPVALTGRVWCYVDAEASAVAPGDLLTTSDVPGHAMKVTDHARAQGAIVGKAMTRLDHGRGLVLVLVSLK